MKTEYKGFTIECSRESSWNDSYSGNYLHVYKQQKDGQLLQLIGCWYEGKVKDGISDGRKAVDEYLKQNPQNASYFQKIATAGKKFLSKKEFEEMKRQRRGTGKTLGAVMEVIGKCLMHPHVWHQLDDYEPYTKLTDRQKKENALRSCMFLIKTLNLEGFYINKDNYSVIYRIKWEDE